MQRNRTDAAVSQACLLRDVPNPSSVQGLGLCDVLRVELQPCQIAGAIDELEERRGPLSEAFEHARTRWDAIAAGERDRAATSRLEQELSKSAYALRVLTMIRSQLPTADHTERVALVGPASTMSDLIATAARNSVDDLGELIRESPKRGEAAQARLRRAVEAVAAWVDTYIACEELEWFTFDPPYDPSDRTV